MTEIKEFVLSLWDNVYLRSLFILLAGIVAAYISKFVTRHYLKPLAKRTKTKIDDLIIKSISSVIFYIVFFLGLKIAVTNLPIPSRSLTSFVDSILIFVVCLLLIRVIDNFARQWMMDWKQKTKTTTDERLIPLLQKVVKSVVIILGLIFIFSAWRINISPLLTTAGIAGLTVGLAVKDSLVNVLGGLQLVLDKTFKVGDKVGMDGGEEGVIMDIGLRSTKLKTYDNEIIFIPNGVLANAKIKNFTQPDLSLRVNVDFGVEYGSDPEKVRRVVLEALQKLPGVQEDPAPVVQFVNMSDFALDFKARTWVPSYSDAFSMKLDMTDAVYLALNKAGIGIPFPTHTVYTKDMK
jgi:small-conductance mechanosensitive channel